MLPLAPYLSSIAGMGMAVLALFALTAAVKHLDS
jgi:hypothetical protein